MTNVETPCFTQFSHSKAYSFTVKSSICRQFQRLLTPKTRRKQPFSPGIDESSIETHSFVLIQSTGCAKSVCIARATFVYERVSDSKRRNASPTSQARSRAILSASNSDRDLTARLPWTRENKTNPKT